MRVFVTMHASPFSICHFPLSVRVIIHEVPRTNVIVEGVVGNDIALVTCLLLTGRTEEQKKNLIKGA
jgi:phenylpyruvate tautomerase PptA (4-oxalocrotonate tautomerase family)